MSDNEEMKQPDVDVIPPAFVWNPYLTLANLTFDLETQVTLDLDPRYLYFQAICKIHYNAKCMKITFLDMATLTFDL